MSGLTEAEAKVFWCPASLTTSEAFTEQFSGDSSGNDVAVCGVNRNQDGTMHNNCKCVASDCMFWWWLSEDKAKGCCLKFDRWAQKS